MCGVTDSSSLATNSEWTVFFRSGRTYFRALVVCLWSQRRTEIFTFRPLWWRYQGNLGWLSFCPKFRRELVFPFSHWSSVMFLWHHPKTNIFNFEKRYLKYDEHSSVHSQFSCHYLDNYSSTGRNIFISFLLSTDATENYNGRLILQMIVCTIKKLVQSTVLTPRKLLTSNSRLLLSSIWN